MRSVIDRTRQLADLADVVVRQASVAAPARAGAAPAPAPAIAPDLPPACRNWLSELVLLYGVPFDYLVPAASMLPPETIRFFYLDQNYTNQLIDGAMSIGIGSSLESVTLLGQIENVINQALRGLTAVRAARTGLPAAESPSAPSGFLLRSAAVSGWPGIEVTATDASGRALPLLRLDRLSTDVLICLLGGTPAEVRIHQPAESLHFGVIDDNQGNYSASLRYVSGANAGKQIGTQTVPVSLRTGTVADVVDVSKTHAALAAALRTAGALPAEGLTGAGFAIEMVQSAGVQPFTPTGAGKEAGQ
ncbi:hypothetical protein J2785_005431 [Burkholderia ambifaria]|nr:hypothetical protein [Burkholderia ambifaria]MDR6502251.1 hypothetical protein [Burkholderia ambifaria]